MGNGWGSSSRLGSSSSDGVDSGVGGRAGAGGPGLGAGTGAGAGGTDAGGAGSCSGATGGGNGCGGIVAGAHPLSRTSATSRNLTIPILCIPCSLYFLCLPLIVRTRHFIVKLRLLLSICAYFNARRYHHLKTMMMESICG